MITPAEINSDGPTLLDSPVPKTNVIGHPLVVVILKLNSLDWEVYSSREKELHPLLLTHDVFRFPNKNEEIRTVTYGLSIQPSL